MLFRFLDHRFRVIGEFSIKPETESLLAEVSIYVSRQ